MKTSEFKKIMDESGLEVEDRNDCMFINQYAAINERLSVANISTKCTLQFNIISPFALSDKASDAIIDYARTPIEDREEQYLNVDIPLSIWKEITKGFDSESNAVNNSITSTFKGDDGIDSFFKVIETIQAKYVEHVGYEASYDEIERKNTSH